MRLFPLRSRSQVSEWAANSTVPFVHPSSYHDIMQVNDVNHIDIHTTKYTYDR